MSEPAVMRRIKASRVQPAEQVFRRWSAAPESGTTLEEVCQPGYWAHMGHQFRPRDEITVWCEDNSWCAGLIVTEAGQLFARVVVQYHVALNAATIERGADDADDGLTVAWKGPVAKWTVLQADPANPSNKSVVQNRFENEAAAHDYLRGHRAKLKKAA